MKLKTMKLSIWLVATMVAITMVMSCTTSSDDDDSSTTSTTSANIDATEVIGSTSLASLQVGSSMSVVDSKDASANTKVSAMRIGNFAISAADFAATSDYNQDVTEVFVHERSVEALGTVNEILCMLDQAAYDEMLNQNTYIAQLDADLCKQERDDVSNSQSDAASSQGSSSSASSSSEQKNYEYWTVRSSRADEVSPQIVKLWFDMDEEMGPGDNLKQQLQAKLVILEGKSDENPYGIFTMNFISYYIDDVAGVIESDEAIIMRGILRAEKDSTGKVILKFLTNMEIAEDDGSFSMSMTQKAAIDRAADGASGSGSISDSFAVTMNGQPLADQSKSMSFNLAYNDNYFLRQDIDGNETCLDRNAFDETVWRYGLYDSTGTRLEQNSGFPIKYTDLNNNEYYGWIGYWGLWMPGEASISDGETVSKFDYGQQGDEATTTDYTVFMAQGKLIKHTKLNLTLGDIQGIPLYYWHDSTGTQYVVKYGSGAFTVESKKDNSWNDVELGVGDPTTIDLSGMQWPNLNFWSQALGGSVQVELATDGAGAECTLNDGGDPNDWSTNTYDCTVVDATNIIFYSEDVVFPDDVSGNLTLACLSDCPNPAYIAGTASSSLSGNDYYFDKSHWAYTDPDGLNNQNVAPNIGSMTEGTHYYGYTFDQAAMMLKYGADNVEWPAGTPAPTDGQDMVWTGVLFEFTQANLDLLACDWDNTRLCPWQAWNVLDVYYTWETGPNDWNKFTALKDGSNNFLEFDPPKQVKYTHTGDGYSGAVFYLDYNGFGDLHGIPGKCVSADTGEDVACEMDGEHIRWVSEFSIANGANVTDAADGTTEYVVKGLEKEQRMTSVAISSCSALSYGSFTLPAVSEWTNPAIGTKPELTDAPKVIAGEVQGN